MCVRQRFLLCAPHANDDSNKAASNTSLFVFYSFKEGTVTGTKKRYRHGGSGGTRDREGAHHTHYNTHA